MTEKPIRIQRQRTKGWTMPPNTVSITRPGKFGNPFRWQDLREHYPKLTSGRLRAMCVTEFKRWLDGDDSNWEGPEADKARKLILDSLHELRGRNVACFCPVGAVCHGDTYLELANQPPEKD